MRKLTADDVVAGFDALLERSDTDARKCLGKILDLAADAESLGVGAVAEAALALASAAIESDYPLAQSIVFYVEDIAEYALLGLEMTPAVRARFEQIQTACAGWNDLFTKPEATSEPEARQGGR
jgi:hypothetical protein